MRAASYHIKFFRKILLWHALCLYGLYSEGKKKLAGFYPEDKKTAYLGPGNILFI